MRKSFPADSAVACGALARPLGRAHLISIARGSGYEGASLTVGLTPVVDEMREYEAHARLLSLESHTPVAFECRFLDLIRNRLHSTGRICR